MGFESVASRSAEVGGVDDGRKKCDRWLYVSYDFLQPRSAWLRSQLGMVMEVVGRGERRKGLTERKKYNSHPAFCWIWRVGSGWGLV